MKSERKDYEQQPFVMEPTKLASLLKAIHERMGDGAQDHFLVHMKGDRRSEFDHVDEILALDNAGSRKITRLIIRSFAKGPGGDDTRREVEVDFGVTRKKEGATQRGVTIYVAGETASWASDALAVVEQQVERTWARTTMPVLVAALILLAVSVSVAFSMLPLGVRPDPVLTLESTMWLTPAQVDEYEAKTAERSLSDADVRQITSAQVVNLSRALAERQKLSRPARLPLATTLLPLAMVAAITLFLLTACYPQVVFLWGDEKDRQVWRENAKRYLWPLLFAITLVPVISRLYLSGAFPGLLSPG